MDRALPEYNTVLHKKWNLHNKKIHRKKVQTTQPAIDNTMPTAYKYPIVKSKKEMIIEERCNEIEKANRILLERMTSILAGPATHNQSHNGLKQKNIFSNGSLLSRRGTSRKRGGTATPARGNAKSQPMIQFQQQSDPNAQNTQQWENQEESGLDKSNINQMSADPSSQSNAFSGQFQKMHASNQNFNVEDENRFVNNEMNHQKKSISKVKQSRMNKFENSAYKSTGRSGSSPSKEWNKFTHQDPIMSEEEPSNEVEANDQTNLPKDNAFFSQRQRKMNKNSTINDFSLNAGQRNKEISRILLENEAMLKRLQNRTSNYNVQSWEKERKSHIKRVKQICMYPPSIISSKKRHVPRKVGRMSVKNLELLDMEKRYASAGPNKHMFEMYNLSMRNFEDMPGLVQGHTYNQGVVQNQNTYIDQQMGENTTESYPQTVNQSDVLTTNQDHLVQSDTDVQQEQQLQQMQNLEEMEKGEAQILNSPGKNSNQEEDEQIQQQQQQQNQEVIENENKDDKADEQDISRNAVTQDGTEKLNTQTQGSQMHLTGRFQNPNEGLQGLQQINNQSQMQFLPSDQNFPNVDRIGVTTAQVSRGGKRRGKKGAGNKLTTSPPKNLGTSSSGAMFNSNSNNMASQPAMQTHINFNVSNNNLSYNNQDIQTQSAQMQPPEPAHLAMQNASLSAMGNQSRFANPTKNQINIVAKKRPPAMPLKNHDAAGIDPKRKVLYRNFHDIDGTIYLVEISRNALKVFILLFPNFEAPDLYLSEIMAEKKAQKLMTESCNMFEELVKKFHIKYGKLQISGFHGQKPDPRRARSQADNSYSRPQFRKQAFQNREQEFNHPVPDSRESQALDELYQAQQVQNINDQEIIVATQDQNGHLQSKIQSSEENKEEELKQQNTQDYISPEDQQQYKQQNQNSFDNRNDPLNEIDLQNTNMFKSGQQSIHDENQPYMIVADDQEGSQNIFTTQQNQRGIYELEQDMQDQALGNQKSVQNPQTQNILGSDKQSSSIVQPGFNASPDMMNQAAVALGSNRTDNYSDEAAEQEVTKLKYQEVSSLQNDKGRNPEISSNIRQLVAESSSNVAGSSVYDTSQAPVPQLQDIAVKTGRTSQSGIDDNYD